MTARRGRKNPALLNPAPVAEESLGTVLVAGRPLRIADYEVPIGVEVPGAADWPRLEAWISARHVKRVPADSEYVRFEDFKASIDAQRELAAQEIVELDPEASEDTETQE